MNELEKCMAGEWYDCHNEIFLEYKNNARNLLAQYNSFAYNQKEEKTEVLKQLFGSIGTNVSINMNCTFVDCNKIEIGDNVLIASNVQIYTATHPVELADRLTPNWNPESGEYFCRTYALPVKIGNGCWIGGGAIILPGVTIGDGTVIGAGSVVTRDIPANCVAIGNPCRVIRKINGESNEACMDELDGGMKR